MAPVKALSSKLLFLFSLSLWATRTVTSSSTCSSRISSESGIELYGFVFKTFQTEELKDCFNKCIENRVCQSINYNLGSLVCQFNRETKRRRPSNVRPKNLGVYMENPERAKKGSHATLAAHSCKEINDLGEAQGDGEYWIDPGNTGAEPFTVYCDMTTDSGGWTLIKRLKLNTTSPESAHVRQKYYRSISRYTTENAVYVPALVINELRNVMGFHQLRWRCHKKTIGRTVHIQTTNDSAGHKVLHHFLVKPTWPTACGSFQRLPDDNSELSRNCNRWGKNKQTFEVNRWGKGTQNGVNRIYNDAIFMVNRHSVSFIRGAYYCDDYQSKGLDTYRPLSVGDTYRPLSVGDTWELYVR